MPYSFENRIILVTGGAGDIGAAICRALDAGEACVLAADVDTEAGERLRPQLRHPKSRFLLLDVSDSAQVDRVFDQVEAEWGPLDGLVNAAGIAPTGPCTETTDADWRRTIETN